jgi:anti-sigma factor ChrR (cupin superfamily)
MTCRHASELHTAAAEGALSGTEKALYALHMKICGPCKRFRSQLETTASVLRKMPHEEPPTALVDQLAAELDKKL